MKDLKRAEKWRNRKRIGYGLLNGYMRIRKARLVYFRKEILRSRMRTKPVSGFLRTQDINFMSTGSWRRQGWLKGDREVWFADTVDIRPYLKGRQHLAVIVLRYPMERENGNHGMFRSEIPGFYLTGAIHFAGGNKAEHCCG